MAKLFNVFIEADNSEEPNYLGSYRAKTFCEAVRAAIKDNDLDIRLYDKKLNEYDGYRLIEKE